jgi:hypothetical protein
MNRRGFVVSTVACAVELAATRAIFAQKKAAEPDLGKLAEEKGLTVFNRTASKVVDGARSGLHLDGREGDGVAYVPGLEFADGTIEIDIRGKDVQQGSFVGVAFHGVDGETYDGVYFRPFNFMAADPARRIRAVQYISHPAYPWHKLREAHPGQYEKAVAPVPDPNGWFRARIVVASPKVSVFVADASEPSLVVTQLSDRKQGRVGVWVGNTSSGDFANLKVIPA